MKRSRYAITTTSVILSKSSEEVARFRPTIAGSMFAGHLYDLINPPRSGKTPARCPFCSSVPSIRKREKDSEANFTGKAYWQVTCGGFAQGHYVVAYGKTQASATKNWNVGAQRA